MRIVYLCLLSFFSLNANAQWTYLGLGHTQTGNLTSLGDTLYASTFDGLYKKHMYSTDTTWIPCGKQGEHVVQTFVSDPSTFISLVEIGNTYTTQLWKSTDAGASFSLLSPDTSLAGAYMYLSMMAHPPGNFDTLYLMNHQRKTFDGGLTWLPMNFQTANDRFIMVNPANHNEILIGGETFILSGYIQKSQDNGNTWNYCAMNNYFAGDNCVHDIAVNGNEWYAAGEGIITKSTDGGDNWTTLMDTWNYPPGFALYNFAIEFSALTPQFIYVSGTNSGADRVPLIWSHDGGSTWDTISTQPSVPGIPNILSLHTAQGMFGDAIFLGGNGVYLYNMIFGGVDENEMNHFSISPNPVKDKFKISLYGMITSNVDVEILDFRGKIVRVLNDMRLPATVSCDEFAAGCYFISIRNEGRLIGRERMVKY